MVDRVELGTATLSRVVELRVDQLPLALFPRVEVDGLTVLVDTGVGNDRDRPAMPPLDHLNTDFLDSLQRAGVAPESVDVVVNTHVHSDHVGWNTKREGDSWVPTFPNARYLIPEADYSVLPPGQRGRATGGAD